MVRFAAVTKDQLNTLWHDTYGWVTSAGVHFIADAYAVISFWITGEIDVNTIDADEKKDISGHHYRHKYLHRGRSAQSVTQRR